MSGEGGRQVKNVPVHYEYWYTVYRLLAHPSMHTEQAQRHAQATRVMRSPLVFAREIVVGTSRRAS